VAEARASSLTGLTVSHQSIDGREKGMVRTMEAQPRRTMTVAGTYNKMW
jgi:hypothetical protein